MQKQAIIGISTNFLQITEPPFTAHNRIYVNSGYIESIVQAGAIPLMLPVNADKATIDHLINMVDGIVLSGGQDVHPSFYHEEAHPLLGATTRERDEFELHLIQRCRENRKPILGICRGLQLINVALGGSLYQDLSQHSASSKEIHALSNAHPVSLTPQSRLHHIYETTSLSTNSYHHQAVKHLGKNLTISAISSDGVVEGIEAQNEWIVGVQWHPEAMINSQPETKKLFAALVSAASRQRSLHT